MLKYLLTSKLHLVVLLLSVVALQAAQAQTVNVAAGWARPPYITPNAHSGYELEIVTHILANLGHDTKVVYLPYQSSIDLLKSKQVDMTLTLHEDTGIGVDMLSDVYINYQNVVLSLKQKDLNINNLQGLANLRVIGFQSAQDVLGEEYLAVTSQNSLYFEMADQRKQVELFLQGDVEAIIIEINVFAYLSREITNQSQFENVNVHTFFPANAFRAGFKDKTLKNQFNRQLKLFLDSPEHQALKTKYQIRSALPSG